MTNPENFNDNTRGGFSVKANPRPLRLGGKCGDKRSSRLTPCCDPSHPCYRQGRPDHCNFDFCLSGALDESDPAFILTDSESSAADGVASSTIADGKVYMQFKGSPASLANGALTDTGGDITYNKVTNPADSYFKIPEVAMGASVDMAYSPGTKVAGDLDMTAHILPVETGAANTQRSSATKPCWLRLPTMASRIRLQRQSVMSGQIPTAHHFSNQTGCWERFSV